MCEPGLSCFVNFFFKLTFSPTAFFALRWFNLIQLVQPHACSWKQAALEHLSPVQCHCEAWWMVWQLAFLDCASVKVGPATFKATLFPQRLQAGIGQKSLAMFLAESYPNKWRSLLLRTSSKQVLLTEFTAYCWYCTIKGCVCVGGDKIEHQVWQLVSAGMLSWNRIFPGVPCEVSATLLKFFLLNATQLWVQMNVSHIYDLPPSPISHPHGKQEKKLFV